MNRESIRAKSNTDHNKSHRLRIHDSFSYANRFSPISRSIAKVSNSSKESSASGGLYGYRDKGTEEDDGRAEGVGLVINGNDDA